MPSGPTTLFRWFQPGSASFWSRLAKTTAYSYAGIYYYLESVVAVYVLGRCLGKVLAKQLQFAESKSMYSTQVTRVVTATLFVHVFAAGLVPEAWTVVLRLVTAILAGMLCGMTSIASLGEVIVHAVWNVSTATKTYWIGFVTCVLLTSFIRAHQGIFMTPLAVVGLALAAKVVFSPVFLTGVAIGAEIILRFLFAFTPDNSTSIPRQISTRRSSVLSLTSASNNRISDSSGSGSRASLTKASATTRTSISSKTDSSPLRQSSTSSSDPLQQTRPPKSPSASRQRPVKQDFISTNSSYSSLEESDRAAVPTSASYETEICIYRDGRCVYADGTPAYVPQGDCVRTVPANFLEFYNFDHARARRAWEATQEWRKERNVWRIHTLPNRWYPRIKEAYPHFIHGHSKQGYPIIYEQPGRMRLKELFRSGCKIDDMIFHYQFFMEFLANIICTRQEVRSLSSSQDNGSGGDVPNWGLMVVMDVQGIGLSSLSKDVLSYLKQAGEVNKSHYPLCTKRAILVNSSFWLAGAWSTVKGLVPDSIQVDVASASQCCQVLCKYIDEDQIPPEYGGSSPHRLGEHPYESRLRQLVLDQQDSSS